MKCVIDKCKNISSLFNPYGNHCDNHLLNMKLTSLLVTLLKTLPSSGKDFYLSTDDLRNKSIEVIHNLIATANTFFEGYPDCEKYTKMLVKECNLRLKEFQYYINNN